MRFGVGDKAQTAAYNAFKSNPDRCFPMTTFVFGHKAPDTDSLGSALIWGWFLNHTGTDAAAERGLREAAPRHAQPKAPRVR